MPFMQCDKPPSLCRARGTITISCCTLSADARFVLSGEATHGTHEFYRERAEITKRLISEKAFSAVAIEGAVCLPKAA